MTTCDVCGRDMGYGADAHCEKCGRTLCNECASLNATQWLCKECNDPLLRSAARIRIIDAIFVALCCGIGLIAACTLDLPNPADPVPPVTTTIAPGPTTIPPVSTTIPPWQKDVGIGAYRLADISGVKFALFTVRQFPSYSPVDPKFGEEKAKRVWIKGSTNQVLNIPQASEAIGWISTIPLADLPASFWYCFEGNAGVSVYYVSDKNKDLYSVKPVLEPTK